MARQLRERSFVRADRDGNGGLSLAEFAAIGPGKPGNPAADPSQVKAAASLSAAVFARADANGDGLVTAAEMEALQAGGAAPPVSISSTTMAALLTGQEAPPGATGPTVRLPRALDGYNRFAAGEPPDPAG